MRSPSSYRSEAWRDNWLDIKKGTMEVPFDGVVVESTATFMQDDEDCMYVHVPISSYCDELGREETDRMECKGDNNGGGILVEDVQGPSSSKAVGSWSLLHRSVDDDQRTSILVTMLFVDGQYLTRSFAMKIAFESPVFSCSCLARVEHGILQIGIITVDGYVHLIVIPYDVAGESTLSDPSGHAVVSSVSIADSLDDAFGKPTSIAMLRDTVCLGGESGSIANIYINNKQLKNGISYLGMKSGILGNVASYFGFSNRQQQSSSSIECMSVVSMSWGGPETKNILLCLHKDATLCIWDVDQKILLHSLALLHEDVEVFVPSCLEYSQDYLNDGGIFLITSFRNIVENYSTISLFELTVDNRTDILSVHVENGPQLPHVDGRVTSASLEFVDANRYYIWFVTENVLTKRYKTERVLFQGDSRGNHTSSQYAVRSLESKLESFASPSEEGQEMLKVYFTEIYNVLKSYGSQNLGNYIVDTIFLPWNYSNTAMRNTFLKLDIPGYYLDDASQKTESRKDFHFSAAKWMENGDSALESFSKCNLLLKTYIEELRCACAPICIKVLQQGPTETESSIVLMRMGDKVSVLTDVSMDSLEYHGAVAKNTMLSSFKAFMEPFFSSSVVAMIQYAVCHGINLKQTILPLMGHVLRGNARINAVEFGMHSEYVRRLWRTFPCQVTSFNIEEILEEVLRLSQCNTNESSSSMDLQDNIDRVVSSLAKSALYGYSTARLEAFFPLLIVLEYNRLNSKILYERNLTTMIDREFISYWACTAPLLQGTGKKTLKVPGFSESTEHTSKKLKRLQIEEKECHGFDLWFGGVQSVGETVLQSKELVDIAAFTSNIACRFLEHANHVDEFLLVVMRQKTILNKEESLESLLSLIESLDRTKDVTTKFFKAYVISKKAGQSLDESMKSVLEQQGLGLFLSLCDCIQYPYYAESLLACFESMGKAISAPLTEEKYIDGVAGILDHLGCVSSMERCGLFSARLQESLGTKEGHDNAVRTRSRVYKALEESRKVEEAYTVALSIVDPQRQLDCLRGLVDHLCTHRDIETLCTLPMIQTNSESTINVLDQIIHTLWERALKEVIDESLTYSVLFDIYVTRNNFQSAAAALLSYSRRLWKESEKQSLDILLDLQKSLTLVIGCLKLVNSADAWLEDASDLHVHVKQTWFEGSILSKEYTLPHIVDANCIERESMVVKSLIQIVSILPEFDIHSSTSHILYQLLDLRLYSESWDFATVVFSLTERQKMKELIVLSLSKECATSQSPSNWELLKSFIKKEESCLAVADRLRLIAADAILGIDDTLGIPPWMMEPYLCRYEILMGTSVPQNHKSDAAGMIRVLLKHGRIELAGQLTMELVSPIVTRIPSMALSKVGSACIPVNLIAEVTRGLASCGDESTSLLLKRLQEAQDIVQQSSTLQTSVLEKLLSA